MIVRPLAVEDLAAVKRVIDATALFPSEMLDEMTAPFLSDPSSEEFWLVAEDREPVGVAYCAPERMTQGTWNTLLIAVEPSRHGQGLGRRIMAEVEAALKARGHRLLLVETSADPAFEGTRGFYRRLGYGEEARIRDFYRAGEDKVVFRKDLTA